MLAEYNVRPPQINASTITTGAKVILTAPTCLNCLALDIVVQVMALISSVIIIHKCYGENPNLK